MAMWPGPLCLAFPLNDLTRALLSQGLSLPSPRGDQYPSNCSAGMRSPHGGIRHGRPGILIPPLWQLTQRTGRYRSNYQSAWRTVNTGSNPLGGTSEIARSMTATLSDPEVQPDIQHRRGMGERTHRDHVDTRGGDFPDRREVDSS